MPAADETELDRVATAAVRAKLRSGGAIDLKSAVEVEVNSAGFDDDGLREKVEVLESEVRAKALERSAREMRASQQDQIRIDFGAGRMTMPEFAKAAREAGISAGEVTAALKERAAADKVAERTAAAAAAAQKEAAAAAESDGDWAVLSAAKAAKAQGARAAAPWRRRAGG